jgi:zinc/manganese transport system ATP-binding protein
MLPAALSLTAVGARHGSVRALHDVSLDILPGEVLAVSGANGSGKSTLLAVLAGTQQHTGTVRRGTASRVAFVVQRSAVPEGLPLTVHDVVGMGRWSRLGAWRPARRSDRDIVDESLDALGLGDLARRPLRTLSGGQRQRTLVAQGLAQRADVLLLDEPTVGLDSDAGGLIRRAIERERARGVAVVQATHDPEVIAAADRVVVLRQGSSSGVGAAPLG